MLKNLWLPQSRTYWMGIFLILCGLIEFADALYPLGLIGLIMKALFGSTTPFMLVLGGAIVVTGRASIQSLVTL